MTTKDEEILGLWSEFFVAHALSIRRLEEVLEDKAPLSIDEYDVLLCISRSQDQRIRFSALAEAAVYTRSGITRIMRRMEASGYVRKETCPEDKRGSFAVLTDDGKRALRDTWRCYSSGVLRVFSPLFNQHEASQLRQLLARVAEALSQPELVQIRAKS